MLVPSWKFTEENRRTRHSRPGAHREEFVIDDRSGPVWDAPTEVIPTAAVDIIIEIPPVVDVIDLNELADQDKTAIVPIVEPTPQLHTPINDVVVDRTEVLPSADTEEASASLASLFGFSERQVSFLSDRSRDLEVMGDTAWESLPSLADVAIDGEVTTGTGDAIQRLWDATEDHSIAVTPLDTPIDDQRERLIDNRRFRRTALIGLVGLLVAVGWGVRELSSQPERVAQAREQQYALAASQISEAIGPVERSVAVITAEELNSSDFSQLTSDLDTLDGIARTAAGLAAERLPRASTVGSSLPIDVLVLPQSLLEQGSLQALNIEQRIGDAISYRLIFARAFDLPTLPDRATLTEIGTIGAGLSVAIAETEQVLAELPDDAFFARHRQEAFDLLEGITISQGDYFDGLRNDDRAGAAAIRDAMNQSIDQLRASLSEPLAATEAWTQTQVAQLRTVLAELHELVSQKS